jgi:hypothetical protein
LLHGTVPKAGDPPKAGDAPETRRTFLVNVWLNHRPSNCQRLSKAGKVKGRIAWIALKIAKNVVL